jgi:hypothetical protein
MMGGEEHVFDAVTATKTYNMSGTTICRYETNW